MNVKRLIELLQKEDPEMRVVVQGYEGGYDELDKLQRVAITANKGKNKQDAWWYGEFLEASLDSGNEIVLLFPRK